MSITVNGEQLTLANRSAVECVPLVVLETFTDRDAETVGATRYYTRTGRAVVYKWDGSNDQAFEPFLEFVSPIDRGFDHIPDASAFATRDVINVDFDSSPRAGEYLWQELLEENIVGARVTIASILIPVSHSSHDLGFSAAVHVVRWRGEVTRLTNIKAEATRFTLVAESLETKLATTVFVSGDQAADVPVLLDSTVGVVCKPMSIRHSGIVQSETIGDGGDETIAVIWDNADPPPDAGSSTYPVTWTKPGETDTGSDRVDNIWYANTYSSAGVRDVGWYEEITNPGAGGAPEVDITHTLSLGTYAIAGNVVRVARWPMSFAIGGGYARRLSRLLVESAVGRFSTADIVTNGQGECEWYLSTDESDPDNVVSYVNFVPHSRFNAGGDIWLGMIDFEDVTVTADVDGVWAPPASSWSTLVDVSTWGLTATDTAIYQGEQKEGAQSDPRYTSYQTVNSADTNLVRLASTQMLAFSQNSAFPEQLGAHFRGITPGVGDKQFEVTINVSSTQLAKVQRIHLAADGASATGRGTRPGGSGYKMFKADELTSGDNVLTFEAVVPDPLTDEIDSIMVLVDYNEITTEKSIHFTENIRVRDLEVLAAANHPTDAITTIIEDFLPGGGLAVDATTFATAKANTPNLAVTPDLTRFPSLGELLAAVGFAGRTNFVYAEASAGTVIKAYAAETDYDFSSPIRAIGAQFTDMELTLRPITEIANRFTWLYDLIDGEDDGFIENYRGNIRATGASNPYTTTPADADYTDSEAAFGVRESIAIPITMIRDAASALDVTGYYVNESLRGQVARYSCLVPYWIGYDIEPGDIVSIMPSWESSVTKARILRTVFSFDEHGVGFVLEAVT